MSSHPGTTRIADLPENITMQIQPNSFPVNLPQPPVQQQQPQSRQNSAIEGLPNNYLPMNIHPNPYISENAMNGEIPFPENVHQTNRLPSRDIPMDSAGYIQDEQIQPNYIPKATNPTDYIREHDSKMSDKLRQHEKEQYRKETAQDLFALLQTPIFLAILYFFFQLPILNRLLYKFAAFLPFFKEDGNLNLVGMVTKSAVFGAIYLFMDKIIQYLTFL
jgi:hypothetical protein